MDAALPDAASPPVRARPCPGPGLAPAALVAALARSGAGAGLPDWPALAGRRGLLTQSCRTAIALLPAALGLEPGSEVLLPAYHCGSEFDALAAAGLVPRPVETDARGLLDPDRLAAAAGPRTRAVYVIHPFGFAQPLDAIAPWARAAGLALIEDCALSLFSAGPDGRPLGTRGDAALFSLPKTLAVPDGGLLTWAGPWAGPGPLPPLPPGRSLRRAAGLLRDWARRRGLAGAGGAAGAAGAEAGTGTATGPGLPDMPADYYFAGWRAGRGASGLTRRLALAADPGAIAARRRANHAALARALGPLRDAMPFPDLAPGTVPLGLALRRADRNGDVARLRRAGIAVSRWWEGGHRAVDWSAFPAAAGLKRSLLLLPVHQDLDAGDMARIAELVRAGGEGR
jgi:dTDP-4-amino-4,6-dideoxygalactose transaminase